MKTREEKKKYAAEYYRKNRDKQLADAHRRYLEKCGGCLKRKPQTEEEKKAGKTRRFLYRYRNDPTHRATVCLRARLNHAFRGRVKPGATMALMGCDLAQFWAHLESQFSEGMTRENYGTFWHLDHIFPLSKANLEDKTEAMAVCHYLNLRPCLSADNVRKGDSVTQEARFNLEKIVALLRSRAVAT